MTAQRGERTSLKGSLRVTASPRAKALHLLVTQSSDSYGSLVCCPINSWYQSFLGSMSTCHPVDLKKWSAMAGFKEHSLEKERDQGPKWGGGTRPLVGDTRPTQPVGSGARQVDLSFGSLVFPRVPEKKHACLPREEKVLCKTQTESILYEP